MVGDPETLDPHRLGTIITWSAMLPFCEALYSLDARGDPVPQLTTGMPAVSDDGRTVTLQLREGVSFNDGTPFDAAAVRASIARAAANSPFFREIPLASIATPTRTEVVLKLRAPYAPLASDLAGPQGMVISPTQLRRLGEARFGTDPVCVGPFRFAGRRAGEAITLTRSDRYYDQDAVNLDEIDLRVIEDPSARTIALRNGDVDVIETPQGSDLAQLESDDSVRVNRTLSLGWAAFVVNVGNSDGVGRAPRVRDTPLARSELVREAFSTAIDREALVSVNPGGTNEASCSLISSASRYFDDPDCPAHDAERSRELIAEAGFQEPVPVSLLVPGNAATLRVAEAVKQMLDDGGFDTRIDSCEPASCAERWISGDYDVAFFGFGGLPDPDANVSPFVSSTGGYMINGLPNREIDELLRSAREEHTDDARRAELYRRALDIVRADGGVVPIANTGYVIAAGDDVTGYRVTPAGVTYYDTAGFAG